MTEHHVEIVRIGDIEKHPDADTLSITKIHGGYPVLFRTGDYKSGDLAIYLPVDSIAPDTEAFSFLGSSKRIRAKKLRGVFSMGLLTPVPEGLDVADALGVTKYEPPEPNGHYSSGVVNSYPAPNLNIAPGVYDLEPLRKQPAAFDEVDCIVHEKIHGQNFRAVLTQDNVLHVGSRNRWLSPSDDNTWNRVSKRYELAEKLTASQFAHGLVVFGEIYGNNADMPYGVDRAIDGDALAVFDVYDSSVGEWLQPDDVAMFCELSQLPMAPILVTFKAGESSFEKLCALAEGTTTINGASHVREGIVVRSSINRRDKFGGRLVLKLAGEGYHTRKGAS